MDITCKHCGLKISRWDDANAERLEGRSPLYIHDDHLDGAPDAGPLGNGIHCDRDLETYAEPAEPCGPAEADMHREVANA